MGKMIGIDLGTANSCVAVMEGGVPQVVPNQEGQRTTPSVVAFTPDGQRLVGSIAKQQALRNPKGTILGAKRLIGRKFDSRECEAVRRFATFDLVPATNGDVEVELDGRRHSMPEICSLVLGKLKEAAEDYLGERVDEAVITVPAYFNDPQRQATRDAGLIAGLEVSRIINEPTAAALAYGLRHTGENGRFVAVYDLGGGTFDITILEMADGLFQVRATSGDTFLGGDDFDERVMAWFLAEYEREAGAGLPRTPELLLRLRAAAELTKRELSVASEARIEFPFDAPPASGASVFSRVLTRFEYEALTHDLVEQTVETCHRCLADAGMRPQRLDEVLLVGGQSRAPGVARAVREIFGRAPSLALHPDEAVAMGAAIQTGVIRGEVKDLVLLDVTPHTLGIETQDGSFTPLIDRNSTIPTRKSRMFTTVADEQSRVEVHVLQGESDQAAYNKSLQRFELTGIPLLPRGKPQIEVGFEVDVNGIVSVEATDQMSRRRQAITIHPSGGLSPAEVNRLVDEARKRDSDEKSKKEQEAVVWQLDGLLISAIHSVQLIENKLTPEEQQFVLDCIAQGRRARRQGGLVDLKAALAGMSRAADTIGRAMQRP